VSELARWCSIGVASLFDEIRWRMLVVSCTTLSPSLPDDPSCSESSKVPVFSATPDNSDSSSKGFVSSSDSPVSIDGVSGGALEPVVLDSSVERAGDGSGGGTSRCCGRGSGRVGSISLHLLMLSSALLYAKMMAKDEEGRK
jgi:hypothetical protein